MTRPHLDELDRLGYSVIPRVISSTARRALATVFDACVGQAGRRDGLAHQTVRTISASAPVRDIVQPILGRGAFALRATLFDKTPGANWLVTWHQDITIPVQVRRDTPGFEAWSIKGGVPHVRPPARVLRTILAVRIDVDGSNQANGSLRVIAGTHQAGILSPSEIQRIVREEPTVECHVPPGGALIMRPLLLHSSSRACLPSHRRILHLEFAAGDLPGELHWHDPETALSR